MESRRFDSVDHVLGGIDRIIKNLTAPPRASREVPESAAAEALPAPERAESIRLMRVNHSGEVAAQALYQGQALTARNAEVKSSMHRAAAEEMDHLAWCEQRLSELQGRPSLLNPLWYFGSLGLGAFAGALGDRVSLSFIAETEKQVESHLRDHLDRLSARDLRSRAILEQMTHDEMQHGAKAASMGGKPVPQSVALAMRALSRLMTKGSYWI
jgi:ubiquinone biosynthesis monooxygenase Coq7